MPLVLAGLMALGGAAEALLNRGQILTGALAASEATEEKEYFIFDDQELLEKLYDGLAMKGVKEDTVVEGFHSYTDNTTNDLAAGLFREADGMEIIFLRDKDVRDPESKFVPKKIIYCDFDEGTQFRFSQRYDDAGNSIYFINLADLDSNTILKCQITEEEARKGFAALDTLSLKDDVSGKRKNFMSFCTELQENYPEIAQALVEMSTATSAETEAPATVEEIKPFIFDEEYINSLLDGFVREGKEEIDGYISDFGVNPKSLNLMFRNTIDHWYLNIQTDKGIGDAKSKVTQVQFDSIADDASDYYGFAQRYIYDKKGQRKTNNIIFIGPLGSTEVMGYDGLSDEDFNRGVTMLRETDIRDRKGAFDKFFEEMAPKYAR